MSSFPTLSYRDRIPELAVLEAIIASLKGHARIDVLDTVKHGTSEFPLYSVCLGSMRPDAPTLGIFGGVHGLERIGAQVALSFLETLASLLQWDETLQSQLQEVRLVFMPIVNPVGIFLRRRANGNGVDLMRSSPIDADRATFLVGGHRLSPNLPWFRGVPGAPMEKEAAALCKLAEREILPSKASISVDIHSGFGMVDRLWFPYAKTQKPFPHLPEAMALKRKLDETLPNHVYQYEPQAKNYVTHGDLWDHLYEKQRAEGSSKVYLPLTLEIGSWLWLKKNPIQAFSYLGPFNPVKPHRMRRTLRRHLPLFDFLLRSVRSHATWSQLSPDARRDHERAALDLWYEGKRN